MLPVLLQPFSSVAQANMRVGFSVFSSFIDGMRQINELSLEALQSSFPNGERSERDAPAMFMEIPSRAVSFASDVMSIMGATASKMIDAAAGRSFVDRDEAPKLVLLDGSNSFTGETAILDANGDVVKRITQ